MKKKVVKKKTVKKKVAKKAIKKSKRFVIVRSHTAGVHFGEFVSREGDALILKNSRRLWRWQGASLSQVAVAGPASGDNRFGMTVSKTEIVSPQGFEIADCSKLAAIAILSVTDWRV